MNKTAVSPPYRYPSGQIIEADTTPRKETPEEAMAIARWQREKLGATPENFRAHEWGSWVGRMRAWAVIAQSDSEGLSRPQYDALTAFINARHRARMAQGYPADTTRSPSVEMVSFGIPLGMEMDEEEVMRLVRAWNGAKSALLEYLDRGKAWIQLLEKLAREEGDEPLWRASLGEVRSAANVLVRYYKTS